MIDTTANRDNGVFTNDGEIIPAQLTVAKMIEAFKRIENSTTDSHQSDHSDTQIISAVLKHLPNATARKLMLINRDVTLARIIELLDNTDNKENLSFDDFDDSHFGLFTTWYFGFRALITATFNTFRNLLRKKGKQLNKNRVSLGYALLALLIVPLLLTPLIMYIHEQSQCAWKTLQQALPEKALFLQGMAFVFLLPFMTIARTLLGLKTHEKDQESTYVKTKILARSLVLFGALGSGFIAFVAIMSTTGPLAAIGAFAWVFFIAGLLSEFQSHELSVYKTLCKFQTNTSPLLFRELEVKMADSCQKYWGTNKKTALHAWEALSDQLKRKRRFKQMLQVGAFGFSVMIAISMFAVTYINTQTAILIIAGAASMATAPWWVAPLIALIATTTAFATFCLVYRVFRDAIHDDNGNNILTVWAKRIYLGCTKILTTNPNEKLITKFMKPFLPLVFIALIVLTLVYVITAGPVFIDAMQTVFQSSLAAAILGGIYYFAMTIYFAGSTQYSMEILTEYLSIAGNTIEDVIASSVWQMQKTWRTSKPWLRPALLFVMFVEGIVRLSCYLFILVALSFGLFFVHMLGESAAVSEEPGPLGMSQKTLLLLNAFSSFLSNIGFLLEWGLGCDGHAHYAESVQNLNSEINLAYAFLCLTVVIPWAHALVYTGLCGINSLSQRCGSKPLLSKQTLHKLNPETWLFYRKGHDQLEKIKQPEKISPETFNESKPQPKTTLTPASSEEIHPWVQPLLPRPSQ